MKQYVFFIVVVFMGLISMTMLIAQEDNDNENASEAETTPEPVDCDALADIQIELSALLADFETLVDEDQDTALANLYEVGVAYQELAIACGYIPPNAGELVIGTDDLERIMTVLETLDGDSQMGQLLYNGAENSASGATVSCSGCHEAGLVAPPTSGTWTRWDEEHSLEPRFADYTFEQYIVESIIHPNDYPAEGYQSGLMPTIYADQLGFQDLADIVAYLESQDQLP